MRVLSLKLENVGPFDAAEMELVSDPEAEKAPIALLTGINGTGKTIVLDAIRGLFGHQYCRLERRIWRRRTPFAIQLVVSRDGKTRLLTSDKTLGGALVVEEQEGSPVTGDVLATVPSRVKLEQTTPDWVVDFWRNAPATGSHEIQGLVAQDPLEYLDAALQGTLESSRVTELITHFDYLRDSREPRERRAGEVLFSKIGEIMRVSLLDGELTAVERSTFTPMVKQSGQIVPLANVSSGNAYLIQHLVSMLGKMYAVHVLRETDPSEIGLTPGLLLMDEAESQLHPLWQKRLFKIIHSLFPNLQIIAATHAPFILASAPGARVFVCRYDEERGSCVVEEASDSYASKPVEEILVSEAFDHTQPFSEEISDLIVARKGAIERGNWRERKEIEAKLKQKNPEYFSYFDVEERLHAVAGAR